MTTSYNPQSIFNLPCPPQAASSLGNGCGFVLLCNPAKNSNSIGYVMAVDGSNMSDPVLTPINIDSAITMYPLNLYNKTSFNLFSIFQTQGTNDQNQYVRILSYSNEGQFLQRSKTITALLNEYTYAYQLSSTQGFNVIGAVGTESLFISSDNNLDITTYNYNAYSNFTKSLPVLDYVSEQYFASSTKLVTAVGAIQKFGSKAVYSMVYNAIQNQPTPLSNLIEVSSSSTVSGGCISSATLIDGTQVP